LTIRGVRVVRDCGKVGNPGLTGLCDYPCQTNIREFTALFYSCPHACSVAAWHYLYLVAWCWTREYVELWDMKVLLDVLKIPWSWYFEFWNPAVFNWPTVISWKKMQSSYGNARYLWRASSVCDV